MISTPSQRCSIYHISIWNWLLKIISGMLKSCYGSCRAGNFWQQIKRKSKCEQLLLPIIELKTPHEDLNSIKILILVIKTWERALIFLCNGLGNELLSLLEMNKEICCFLWNCIIFGVCDTIKFYYNSQQSHTISICLRLHCAPLNK